MHLIRAARTTAHASRAWKRRNGGGRGCAVRRGRIRSVPFVSWRRMSGRASVHASRRLSARTDTLAWEGERPREPPSVYVMVCWAVWPSEVCFDRINRICGIESCWPSGEAQSVCALSIRLPYRDFTFAAHWPDRSEATCRSLCGRSGRNRPATGTRAILRFRKCGYPYLSEAVLRASCATKAGRRAVRNPCRCEKAA